MKLFKKVYWLIYPVLFIVFFLINDKIFKIEEIKTSVFIAVILSFILSPKVRMVNKQTGEEEQIKWLFLKKVINKEI